MKINERTLVQVVNSSQTPVDRSGWLYKRGAINRSFQKRWCVLKGNLFYYFDKKTDREPIGVIILEGCRIELAENETELFAFKIDFGSYSQNPLRTYVLGTDSQQDMECWMKSLSCASYDYLKMIVSELQRKLDDINDMQQKRIRKQDNSHQNVRINPFDSENSDLIDLKGAQMATNSFQSGNSSQFTRRAFAEIHESYGLKFRSYLEEQRNKHQKNLI